MSEKPGRARRVVLFVRATRVGAVTNPDPYDDGVAIELSLSRAAIDDDISKAQDVLDEWASAYESEDTQRYRNCGVSGAAGDERIVLWLDRVDDPDGKDAALERAKKIAARAERELPVASWKLSGAEAASDADLEARIGSAPIKVRPGGDAAAEVARSTEQKPWGIRPSFYWLLPIVLVRLGVRFGNVPDPLSIQVSSGSTIAAIALLTGASWAWCTWRERALALAAIAGAAAHLAVAMYMPGDETAANATRIGEVVLAIGWAYMWLGRAK
jgi:hypothetical protein